MRRQSIQSTLIICDSNVVNRTLNPEKDRKRKTEKLEMPETPEKNQKRKCQKQLVFSSSIKKLKKYLLY